LELLLGLPFASFTRVNGAPFVVLAFQPTAPTGLWHRRFLDGCGGWGGHCDGDSVPRAGSVRSGPTPENRYHTWSASNTPTADSAPDRGVEPAACWTGDVSERRWQFKAYRANRLAILGRPRGKRNPPLIQPNTQHTYEVTNSAAALEAADGSKRGSRSIGSN
jgi:hypothetical protein